MFKTLFVSIALTASLTACFNEKPAPQPAMPAGQFAVDAAPAGSVRARTACYDGILYFAMWNNNAFATPYLTGAVIDKETKQPKECK